TPHSALSVVTYREQPAGEVEYEAAQKFPGNESLKNSDIFIRLFRKNYCITTLATILKNRNRE
ncbi:MAG: hypothetical protein ACOC2M_02020, partial [bacterium]